MDRAPRTRPPAPGNATSVSRTARSARTASLTPTRGRGDSPRKTVSRAFNRARPSAHLPVPTCTQSLAPGDCFSLTPAPRPATIARNRGAGRGAPHAPPRLPQSRPQAGSTHRATRRETPLLGPTRPRRVRGTRPHALTFLPACQTVGHWVPPRNLQNRIPRPPPPVARAASPGTRACTLPVVSATLSPSPERRRT